jgi:aminoglycoside/choline kinase family phosphotransferase
MPNPISPWDSPVWLEEARAWINTTLEENNYRLIGEIEQVQIRPWSTILLAQTNKGKVFFKAAAPFLDHEPALLDLLAHLHPHVSPDILKIDPSQGWILMEDCGTPLRTFIKAENNIERWRKIIPIFVRLQKKLISHVDEILHLGVFDRRLESLPAQFENLLADDACMLLNQSNGLTSDEYQRLKHVGEKFRQMCTELSTYGIPATLHHDDFHDGNVFLKGNRVIFTDWGESAIAHPFFTLVVMLRGVENSLNLSPEAPEAAIVRDWYLEEWQDFIPLGELHKASTLAQQIGLINRAITWQHIISNMPDRQKPEYNVAVPSYLKDFIETIGRAA